MLIGYEAFRSLVFYTDKTKKRMSPAEVDRIEKAVTEYLLKPGKRFGFFAANFVVKKFFFYKRS